MHGENAFNCSRAIVTFKLNVSIAGDQCVHPCIKCKALSAPNLKIGINGMYDTSSKGEMMSVIHC